MNVLAREEFYAHIENGQYRHFYKSIAAMRLCSTVLPIHLVKVSESETGSYFGWLYLQGRLVNSYSMIYSNRESVEICFAYGTAIEERLGKGKVVQLHVEKICEI